MSVKIYSKEEARRAVMAIYDRAEAGHFKSRDHFHATLGAQSYIAVQGYDRKGKIFFWNKASEDLYGYAAEEVMGQDLISLILPGSLREYARTAILFSSKGNKSLPPPDIVHLVNKAGKYVTVFSGHLMLDWGQSEGVEFYCVDLAARV
jgi:PAS domain S-box-containing protein